MTLKTISVNQFIEEIDESKRDAFKKLRASIKKNIDKGFKEIVVERFIRYVVPHNIYPEGYHCNPEQPLPFISIAAQKNNLITHHLGLYASPAFLVWLTEEYPKYAKYRLDVGKGCVRFKKLDDIPFDLIAKLVARISLKDWIAI